MTARLYALLTALLLLGALFSLTLNRIGLPGTQSWWALWQSDPESARLILWNIRLPRLLLAIIVGGALGISGAALQGLFRNPLAEPGITGVSSGAALAAILVFYFGAMDAFPLALPVAGITGALLAVGLLYLVAGRGATTLTLILAGVAISSIAGALSALALNLAPSPYAAVEIVYWSMGSLTDRSMNHVLLAAPFIFVGAVLLLTAGRSLDALTLGEDAATAMGVNVARTRLMVILGSGLAVGAAVSVSGVIGFVGLVAPHMLRPFLGHRPAALLPASFLGGAALLLLADAAVRAFSPGPELKIGVVTALVGAPFFLWAVFASRRDA